MSKLPARLAFALLCVTSTLGAQTDDGTTFRWSGRVAAGRAIRLSNMNGDIRVERGSGPNVEVIGLRKVRRGDPKVVRFEVRMRTDGDVAICALWGSDMRCTDDGSEGSYRSGGWRSGNEISVDMRVTVPDGVRTVARSTNGNVNADGLTSDIDASTTNGNVNVRTTGAIMNATSTNGSVTARLGVLRGNEAMRFSTTNGSVTVFAPASLSADVELSTTNGSVTTDFPLTTSGAVSNKRMRGTIGSGGRTLVVHSTNGDVSIKRGGS